MYIDESGDVGIENSPTNYFVLSAFVIHEESWLDILDDLIEFRRYLKQRYGLKMKEEIHASEFVNGRVNLFAEIPKNDRIDLLKKCLKWLDGRTDLSIISIRCDKQKTARISKNDVFEFTWRALIQRFENTLSHKNFPGGNIHDKGIIVADNTDGGKLTVLLRKMRRMNYIPNSNSRNMRLRAVIEDPIMRDSANSYFHQMIDVVAFFARQFYEPNRHIRKKGARTFYTKFLTNATNPHVTNYKTNNNIVEI